MQDDNENEKMQEPGDDAQAGHRVVSEVSMQYIGRQAATSAAAAEPKDDEQVPARKGGKKAEKPAEKKPKKEPKEPWLFMVQVSGSGFECSF